MSGRAKELAERLRAFNDEVITFVEDRSEDDWWKMCGMEDWTVGVVARHIGAGHYGGAMGLAEMILKGEALPELTGAQVNEMANEHAREHAGCTKAEVLDILKKNGEALVGFVAGLDDAALDRSGYMTMIGGDVSVQKCIELVVFQSAGEHFGNMKAVVAA